MFSKSDCEQLAPSGNPELARTNDRVVITYLEQFQQNEIIQGARTQIIELLPSGTPNPSSVAHELNLSLRNFQRKLFLSGTSYTELLDQTRYNLACQYLNLPNPQVTEIAYLLGYSDPSNFSRAFKRWSGLTPRQFRHLDSSS